MSVPNIPGYRPLGKLEKMTKACVFVNLPKGKIATDCNALLYVGRVGGEWGRPDTAQYYPYIPDGPRVLPGNPIYGKPLPLP